jgi:putative oxidoreductase
MDALQRYLPAFGRLLIAVLFVLAGFGKLMTPGATQAYIASAGLPVPIAAYVIAVIVELGGGILLILGWQTRIVALVIGVFSIAAALGFHNNLADRLQQIQFLKDVAITGGLLQIVAFGAGAFSLDARRGARAR